MGEDGDNDAIVERRGWAFWSSRPPAWPTQTLGLAVTRLQLCVECVEAWVSRKARWVTRRRNIVFVAIRERDSSHGFLDVQVARRSPLSTTVVDFV